MQNQKAIKISMIAIISFIILVSIFIYFYHRHAAFKKLPDAVIINTVNQPSIGNPNASIRIVAFEDLKCVNCARYNNTLFHSIKKDYIDTGKANYTLINLAFIPGSIPAANAARCVYQQSAPLFFHYIEAIFKNQPPEDQDWATIPTLLTFAAEVKGIDTDKLATCMINNATTNTDFIADNLKLASSLMKPVSTPAVYVNGVIVRPLSKEQFEHVIQQVS